MNLTSRSRYALKIMVDLARQADAALVKRQDIIVRQGIPRKYLDQIMMNLRKAGLVASTRGRLGGYVLGQSPATITIWDVFSAVEVGFVPVKCITGEDGCCDFEEFCQTKEPWALIFAQIKESLTALTLQDVVDGVDDSKSFAAALPGLDTFDCPSGQPSASKKAKAPFQDRPQPVPGPAAVKDSP